MSADITEIRVQHLGKDDVLDIEERAGEDNVRRQEEPVAMGSAGEPVTFGLIFLTAAALKAYVAHLKYKTAILPDAKLTQQIVITRKDGTAEEHTLTFEARAGEHFSDDAVRELSTIPGVATLLEETVQ